MSDVRDDSPMNIAGKLARAFLTSKLTLLTIVAVTLTGLLALAITPREYNPQIVVPAANIIVAKPGATPAEVENLIVKPLEAIMNAQSGVDHTFGYASNDFGVVTVQFKVGQNQENSLVKMYNQLMQNMDRIPPGAMQPLVKPINVDDVPIMTLTLSSASHDDLHLRDVANRLLENLRNVPGVSFTQIIGGSARTVNVWLDPQRLDAAGITLTQVDQMLRGSNVSAPLGDLVQGNRDRALRLSGFLGSAAEVGKIVVGVSPRGRPVYLRDMARIEDGAAEVDESSHFAYGAAAEGRTAGVESPAVTLAIAKKSGTNAVVVANAVLSKLEELKRQAVPAGIDIAVTRNDGEKADAAVNELVSHLGIAIGSVVVILVFFLGWREAGIVTLTVPLILFVVLAVGYAFGQTINRITLFALILSLGLLVDAAIVVIENIHRHLHRGGGKDFGATLIVATNEIGNPTNIATIAVILAFIPMAFVTGMMGPFMAPIPFNVPVAMIASIVIAYMVVPWASYLWLAKKAAREEAMRTESLEEHGQRPSDPLHRAYVRVILPLIEDASRRRTVFIVVALLLAGAMLMPAWQFIRPGGLNGPLSMLGVELKMLPNDNTNTMLLEVDMPAGTALAATDQVAREVGRIVAAHPSVTNYQTFLGITAPIDFAALVRGDLIKRGQNLAQIRVNFVDKHHRDESSHQIANELNEQLMAVRERFPDAKVKLYETPPGPPVQAQVLAELYGPDYEKLRQAAAIIDKEFEGIYGMVNTDDSVTANAESFDIKVDAEKALMSGVAPGQVAQLLRNYVSGFSIGTLHVDNAAEPIDIKVRLPRELRASPETLLSMRLTNPRGTQIPLSAIATVSRVTQAKPIYDRDQHPLVMVGGELLKSSPVYAVLALDSALDGRHLDTPNGGVTFKTGNLGFVAASPKDIVDNTLLWGGEMRLTLDVFRDLGSAFMVALVLIYLVLVGYYKSFVLPFVVMGAIPLTLVGVFPGHWITGQAFTATSMIGVIALAGIVVRNSLLLIDFILDYRQRGFGLKEAVIEAGAVRFRPILLTALAIILGSAIMITDPVFGGLAVSLIFGTFASTALTLVVIPLLYFIWQRRLGAV